MPCVSNECFFNYFISELRQLCFMSFEIIVKTLTNVYGIKANRLVKTPSDTWCNPAKWGQCNAVQWSPSVSLQAKSNANKSYRISIICKRFFLPCVATQQQLTLAVYQLTLYFIVFKRLLKMFGKNFILSLKYTILALPLAVASIQKW